MALFTAAKLMYALLCHAYQIAVMPMGIVSMPSKVRPNSFNSGIDIGS
jgi:hypothetical protein